MIRSRLLRTGIPLNEHREKGARNFLWLPYYPLWAILIIGLDVVVIWAVSTWKPDEAYPDATRQR